MGDRGYHGALPELLHIVQAYVCLSYCWFSLMPIGCLFIGEGDAQQHLLTERLAQDLHTYRQVISKTSGYGNSWYSSYVYGQGAYIA
jgi:hypothetical protein